MFTLFPSELWWLALAASIVTGLFDADLIQRMDLRGGSAMMASLAVWGLVHSLEETLWALGVLRA